MFLGKLAWRIISIKSLGKSFQENPTSIRSHAVTTKSRKEKSLICVILRSTITWINIWVIEDVQWSIMEYLRFIAKFKGQLPTRGQMILKYS